MFIHETESWPSFNWNKETVGILLMKAMHRLGYLGGRMASIGFDNQLLAAVEAVTHDVVASSKIEGIRLDTDEVRSSVARKFGVEVPDYKDPSHYVEGIVEMMLDATQNRHIPLSEQRLFKWHTSLFPNQTDLTVGAYRTDEMSVVSGTFGRERLHYRAPSPDRVPAEMRRFVDWINHADNPASIVKSAIAHLWFVSIHPFDDGNGRIARAISDMILAELVGDGLLFYSLNRQILKDKNHYYKVLERTQRGKGDISEWLEWYVKAFITAVEDAEAMLSMVLRKATFWQNFAELSFNERQRTVLNKYLDGYDAKLTAKNWEKLTGVSKDTALRDIDALVKAGVLIPTPGRVRDIPYSINYTPDKHIGSTFTDLNLQTEGDQTFITACYRNDPTLRDRVSSIDLQRLKDGEITLRDLAFKHFSYLLY